MEKFVTERHKKTHIKYSKRPESKIVFNYLVDFNKTKYILLALFDDCAVAILFLFFKIMPLITIRNCP